MPTEEPEDREERRMKIVVGPFPFLFRFTE
jgi:hypothetical protein